MIFFYRVPFVFLGFFSNKRLTSIIIFTIGIYTLNCHKEFRFLSQILPILFIVEAHGIDICLKNVRWSRFRWILFVGFLLHIVTGIYFSTIDRRGQISVLNYLRENLPRENERFYSIDFLLPCHSTPFYSFIHRNDIQMNFLTCEPNFNVTNENFLDEADRFYSRPRENLLERIENVRPTHLIVFDTFYEQIRDVFDVRRDFFVRKIFFNSHFQHSSRHGKNLFLLEKTSS